MPRPKPILEADALLRYWTGGQWAANVLMLMHLLGAMVLGLLPGRGPAAAP